MNITWLGHAAFLIETSTHAGGVRIITDPFSSRSGYDAINERANIVTLSHHNLKYHSCLEEVFDNPQVVHGLEIIGLEVELHGIRFGAVQVYEDEQGNGPNAMIWLESEGLRVLHMGDVGHPLHDEHVYACGKVDVLLAPVGGTPTIDLAHLNEFITRLEPRLVIPMHFGTAKVDMDILPVERFAGMFPATQVRYENTSTLKVTAEVLSAVAPPTVHVLEHAR
jgi:L-ascorbate metabolism protein UlaG (beta-lactamase superfamily)